MAPSHGAVAARAPAAEHRKLLLAEAGSFRDRFDRSSFQFAHALAGHPLFERRRLARVAEALIARGSAGQFTRLTNQGLSPGSRLHTDLPEERIIEAVLDRDSKSWVKLTSVEEADPEYATLLDDVVAEVQR